MQSMYVIEVPRSEMKTKEDVKRIFGKDDMGDVITDGFLKERNTSIKILAKYAHYDFNYMMEHTLKEWYENHIVFFTESPNFSYTYINDWGNHDIAICTGLAEEYIWESGLKYRMYYV